jgi:hypothetical protein
VGSKVFHLGDFGAFVPVSLLTNHSLSSKYFILIIYPSSKCTKVTQVKFK